MLRIPFKVRAIVGTTIKTFVSDFTGGIPAVSATKRVMIGIAKLACSATEGHAAVSCYESTTATYTGLFNVVCHKRSFGKRKHSLPYIIGLK